ncbi:MAG TPA: carboxypeptidase-like regulatory domain-containing protein, partial [Rhodothermales bacterium]|nr:carboxypeptidase-like regulatory domain-containing protein [Rhodothermales bacterium]
MRRLLITLALCCAVVPVHAQGSFTVQPGSLEEALVQLRRQSGVDFVYARALVLGQETTCRYTGADVAAALRCLLTGTNLEAVPLREGRQYVLRRQPLTPRPLTPVRVRRVSLAGFVLDAHSGEVLPGATVYLPDARRGATASSAGYFIVPEVPEGTYRVRASHVGYYALDTVLTAGATRTVLRLRPSRLEVPEVVVERGRELAAPPPGTTELTAAQLEA